MLLADWMIDSVDDKGRMSLRPVVIGADRESTGYDLKTTDMANSANPKPIPRPSAIKFMRKSDLAPSLLENKSVISIKGERDFEYRFAKGALSQSESPLLENESHESKTKQSLTAPQQKESTEKTKTSLMWQLPFAERKSLLQ